MKISEKHSKHCIFPETIHKNHQNVGGGGKDFKV